MTADEPIEIGFLNPEIAESQDPEPPPADEEDAFAWLAAAFADDETTPPGEAQNESRANDVPLESEPSEHQVPLEPENPKLGQGVPELPPLIPEQSSLPEVEVIEESTERELPQAPPTLSLVPPHSDESEEIDLSELAQKIEATGDLEEPEVPEIEELAPDHSSHAIEALRKRKGFREELLAAFGQIYGR